MEEPKEQPKTGLTLEKLREARRVFDAHERDLTQDHFIAYRCPRCKNVHFSIMEDGERAVVHCDEEPLWNLNRQL